MSPQKLQFSKGEAIRFGWNTAKSNIKFFIVIQLLYIITMIITNSLQGFLQLQNNIALTIASFLLGWLITTAITLISYKIWLTFAENKKPTYSEIFSVLNLFPKFIVSSILFGIILLGVLLLIIIPAGIIGLAGLYPILLKFVIVPLLWLVVVLILSTYFWLKYQFFGYFIVALGNDIGPVEALRLSSRITKGVKRNLYVFWLLSGLILFAGALALIVGLFWAVPTAGVAHAYIFKKLLSQTQPTTS